METARAETDTSKEGTNEKVKMIEKKRRNKEKSKNLKFLYRKQKKRKKKLECVSFCKR